MVHLVRMTDRDAKDWLPAMWSSYFNELLGAGFSSQEATLNIERNEKALFVDGLPNADQRIFRVRDPHQAVGVLWLAKRSDDGIRNEWFIYNIEIAQEFRGRGLGRATMQEAEEYVRSQGGTTLSLSVFGPNLIARNLYESMDYRALSIGMRKELL
jgi:ribosomal protein S18 acetylase RimI-like enzyme